MGFPNFPSNIQAPPPPMGGHRPPPPEVASKANQSYTWAMAGRDGRKLLYLGLGKPLGQGSTISTNRY